MTEGGEASTDGGRDESADAGTGERSFGAHPAPKLPGHESNDGPVGDAEALALSTASTEHPAGQLGPRFNRRSPFVIGLAAAAGVAVTYAIVLVLGSMRSELVLVGSALFVAMGLQPLVAWLERRHLGRGLAVTVVFLIFLALVVGFFAAAIPPMATQTTQLVA
ncbi:MAG: AI-2E family transporter, partial [Mycobacteriaceae bacterium]